MYMCLFPLFLLPQVPNGIQGKDSLCDPPQTVYPWWGYLVTPKYRSLPEEELTNRSLLRGFTEYSTSHGFPNIVRSTGKYLTNTK